MSTSTEFWGLTQKLSTCTLYFNICIYAKHLNGPQGLVRENPLTALEWTLLNYSVVILSRLKVLSRLK